jgi:hypothetical protein
MISTQDTRVSDLFGYQEDYYGFYLSGPIPTVLLPSRAPIFFKCAALPPNKLFQIKASLSSSSMSFSVHSRVGSDWRNIMISWKSILSSLSDHLARNAAQTYRWKSEKPWSSAY